MSKFESGSMAKCIDAKTLTKEGRFLLITNGHLYRVINSGFDFIKFRDNQNAICYSNPDRFVVASKLDIFLSKHIFRGRYHA